MGGACEGVWGVHVRVCVGVHVRVCGGCITACEGV